MQYVFMTFYAANWGTITKHIGIYKIRDYHIFCCKMFIFACPIIARSQCWLFALVSALDYYMTFSISALVLARDPHTKPDSEAGGLIWVESWYQGRYMENFMSWSFYHIFYIDLFQALTFILQKISLNWQNCENKSLRELTFCFESGFKNIPNNVDLYNDVRNCL